jgi:hypothetical protein
MTLKTPTDEPPDEIPPAVGAKSRITFHIEQDEDGYPPVTIETVWARRLGTSDEYVIDNLPFFARDATLGDVVRAKSTPSGLVFEEVVKWSPNSLIRVVVYDPSEMKEIRRKLKELGCSTEEFAERQLIAVDVPGDVKLASVQEYLEGLSQRDIAGYEEPILKQ